jgi:hypothetical protein
MTDPYRAGAVWWANIDFKKGEGERKKYLVLLSDLVQPGDFVVWALTTSKGAQRYPGGTTAACGCPTCQYYRIEDYEEACFELTTWVQFDNAGQSSRSALDSARQNNTAGFIQMLAPEKIRAVLKCALQSRDVPKRDLAHVERAYKALNAPKPKPAAPPPPLSAMAKLKVRYESHGLKCRNEIEGLLKGTTNDLVGVLAEKTPQPERFMEEADEAFALISEQCQCPKAL